MSALRKQSRGAGGEAVLPIILNNNNFAKGAPGEPTLLSFDDASTLFHEFGHALHGLLSQVRYPSQSGTSVRRDFVEFPSQIYEHWLELPETLRRFARHHETGEPLPEATVARLLAARNFNQGCATVEYAASVVLDMRMHAHPAPAGLDIAAFEARVMAEIGMPAGIAPRHRPAHFQHLFAGAGYAAGYYSYLWSEVLDADGFECFENADDPFDPEIAARLRAVLRAGVCRVSGECSWHRGNAAQTRTACLSPAAWLAKRQVPGLSRPRSRTSRSRPAPSRRSRSRQTP